MIGSLHVDPSVSIRTDERVPGKGSTQERRIDCSKGEMKIENCLQLKITYNRVKRHQFYALLCNEGRSKLVVIHRKL